MSTWGRRARQFGRRGRQAAGRAGRNVQRLASQAPEKARKAGACLASKVVGIQHSAGLDRKLMVRSAVLTIGGREGTEPSPAWLQGYAAVVTAALPELQPAPAPSGPERPSWPHGPAMWPEPDDPEPGA
jgi:hypothetical protein